MPILQNRLVLRIARRLTGFVSFEAGLTRGVVPGEHLEAQVRELGRARNKLEKQGLQLKKQDLQLAALKEQLLQQKLQRPVDESSDRRINTISSRLHSLGFVDQALEELHELVADDSRPVRRKLAAWKLCSWYADQYSEEGARQCLELLPIALEGGNTPGILRRGAIIEAEALETLGDTDAARLAVSQALERGPYADLFFARANLEGSVSGRVGWINEALRLHGIPGISCDVSSGRPPLDSLGVQENMQDRVEVSGSAKVSVIIPAYNAEGVIRTALDSVLRQTWPNLEVLVVDDCSTDSTAALVADYVEKDSRVHLIRSETNSGAYVARNMALKVATGEFVTCHDADDWSHPEKIERQARHLLGNPSVMGNNSQQVRTTADFKFYHRGKIRFLLRNGSSLMFRREPVMEAVGYWDSVRFGADNEYRRRIRRVFGNESVVALTTGPLSFTRQSGESLTESRESGVYVPAGARTEYRKAYTHFHNTVGKEDLRYEFPQQERPFPVPEPMWPRREVENGGRRHFDVVLVSDFRLPGGTTSSNVEEIKAQKRMGLRTGLVHLQRYKFNPHLPINHKIRGLLDGDRVQMLVYGERVRCDTLIARYPPSLQDRQQFVPDVKAAGANVVVNQTPMRHYSGDGERVYELDRCEDHLQEHFGEAGTWYPIGPAVRSSLHEHHAQELEGIRLAGEDWTNIIDVNEWWRGSRPPREQSVRIGRHSRDVDVKWPADRDELLAVYPDSDGYEVRVLGGAEAPKKVLGGLPENWNVLEFGAAHPKDFLSNLDVFVYYTHPGLVEAFGRTIIEAMAAGVPAILPHGYRELFGEAAIYAAPSEVKSNINLLMEDDDYYESQITVARDYVERHFGYTKHAARLGK